ncbi:MAG: HAMP domain-containing sensor histidine kinase [Alphaproteobacteria bacterium]
MLPSDKIPLPPLTRSLSARLLVLTMAFVMLGEVLIYVPSVSRYRLVYLQERLAAAHEATLALDAAPDGMISPELEDELLVHARVRSIALRLPDAAYLMLGRPPAVDASFDLREAVPYTLIREAFIALFQPRDRVLRVVGTARIDPGILVDVTLDEAPMRAEMFDYSGRILILSIVLSLMTAALVFLSLHWLMVRPMRRMTASLVAFREAPEDASGDMVVSGRRDEVGVAQRELAEMQRGLRAALKQRAHLAALGAAVGKINHDLRNILSTAVLVSDRLAHSDDPEVKRQTPALIRAIDRAVALCEDTLSFASAGGPQLRRVPVDVPALVDDVEAALTLPADGAISWHNEVAKGFAVTADRDQLFRVLLNLGRNAIDAMRGSGAIHVGARREGALAVIEMTDSGPGLPPKAREHLFEPFSGSARQGGTGLGLPIAREIMRAHGGEVSLAKSDEAGTVFRLELPAD